MDICFDSRITAPSFLIFSNNIQPMYCISQAQSGQGWYTKEPQEPRVANHCPKCLDFYSK